MEISLDADAPRFADHHRPAARRTGAPAEVIRPIRLRPHRIPGFRGYLPQRRMLASHRESGPYIPHLREPGHHRGTPRTTSRLENSASLAPTVAVGLDRIFVSTWAPKSDLWAGLDAIFQ